MQPCVCAKLVDKITTFKQTGSLFLLSNRTYTVTMLMPSTKCSALTQSGKASLLLCPPRGSDASTTLCWAPKALCSKSIAAAANSPWSPLRHPWLAAMTRPVGTPLHSNLTGLVTTASIPHCNLSLQQGQLSLQDDPARQLMHLQHALTRNALHGTGLLMHHCKS